jgi:hypothetical protein
MFRARRNKDERGCHSKWQQDKERHGDKKLLLLVLSCSCWCFVGLLGKKTKKYHYVQPTEVAGIRKKRAIFQKYH